MVVTGQRRKVDIKYFNVSRKIVCLGVITEVEFIAVG